MFNFLSKLHLSNFKKGDEVEILTCPRRDGADAYKGYKGIIEDIELVDKFTNGVGSIILKGETSTFIATGIIGKLKLIKL
jgi:hypothetical protein